MKRDKINVPGVYEALRTYRGVVALMEEHQARLERSCEEVGVECPDLEEVVRPYLKEDVRLRVEVYMDGHVEVKTTDLEPWHASFLWNEKWKLKLVEGERRRPSLKSMDTKMQYDAREQAQKEGFDEILLVDHEGNITEGGITNVFFVKGERLVTPGRGILAGISRELILRAADELGIEVEIRDVGKKELDDFDAVFVSNSIRGMVASGSVLPVMQRIADWCTEFLEGRINRSKNGN